MSLFIQISIVIIAIAFVILMYSLVQTLKILKDALNEIRLTIGQLRTDVSQITVDVKEAIHNTNAMTLDVREKLSSLDVVFETVNDIGQTIHTFTRAAKESAVGLVTPKKDSDKDSIRNESSNHAIKSGVGSAIIDGVVSSLRIWNKIKKK